MGDEEAGVGVKERAQVLSAAVVLFAAVAGGLYVQREIGPKAPAGGPPGVAPSGAWFCPHGGGEAEWTVTLEIANPGPAAVDVRVRTLARGKPSDPKTFTVRPGSLLRVPAAADGRERASIVEYFGGWVAAGWVAHGGGGEGGVAAEPCVPEAGRRWILPDGASLENDESYVVVMNPFAADAVLSITLLTERRDPIRTESWTNVTLRPFHSEAFRLNSNALGERTVSTVIDVSVGRVAAGTLSVSKTGGIRSSVGYLGEPPPTAVLPGGFDQGRTDLVVASSGLQRVALSGTLLQLDASQQVAELADASPPAESARTFPVTTAGPSAIVLAADGPGVAAARRTFGVASDQGSTIAAEPAGAWIVLPAVAGHPTHPGVVLANPGAEPAEVTLWLLPGGGAPTAGPVTVVVPPGSTVPAPKAFVQAAPRAAVLAVAEAGTFVPATASYSLGREGFAAFAVALGVPIPGPWIPGSA